MSDDIFFFVGSRSDLLRRVLEWVVVNAAPIESMVLAEGTSY